MASVAPTNEDTHADPRHSNLHTAPDRRSGRGVSSSLSGARGRAPGIFACGDVRLSPVKRVAAAVGEGSMAIAFVHKFLQQDAR